MKRLSIIAPQQIEVLETDFQKAATSVFVNSTSDLDFEVLRQGDSILPHVHIMKHTGRVGGDLARPVPPIVPRRVVEPFAFSISKEADPQPEDWYGTTIPCVRDFKRISFSDPTDTREDGRHLQNARLFEFNGSLYYLAEARQRVGSEISMVVKLFRYDEASLEMELVYLFPEPVSFASYLGVSIPTAKGSPDWFVFNNKLHVGYRVIDHSENRNQISIWRAESGDSNWKRITYFPIEDSFETPHVGDLRIRFAASTEAVMCVYYAKITEGGRERHDMRSFYSSDSYSFSTISRNYKNAKIVDGGVISPNRSVTNMAYYFVPEFKIGSDYVNFSVKFALYYDKRMASFVVIKGGDPGYTEFKDVLPNNSYIMGIKTSDTSYLSWEPVMAHELIGSETGMMPDHESIDQYNPNSNIDLPDDYKQLVTDVDIVPGDRVNTMILSTEELNPDGYKRYGTALVEFAFIHTDQIETITAPRVYSHGGQVNKEWGFVISPVDPDTTGITCGASYTARSFERFATDGFYINLARWRGNLVSLPKHNTASRTLVYFNRWQNLIREKSHYCFAYSASLGSPDLYPFIKLNTATYEESDARVLCNVSEYLSIENSGEVILPSIVEKTKVRLLDRMAIKARIKFKTFTNQPARVCEFAIKNEDSEGFRVQIGVATNNLTVLWDTGAGFSNVASFPASQIWTNTAEIVFGISNQRIWVAAKNETDMGLSYIGETPLGLLTSVASAYFRVGSMSGSISGVYVNDIQVTTYKQSSKYIFEGTNYLELGYYPPVDNDNYLSMTSRVDSTSEPIQLWDGSLVRLKGAIQNRTAITYVNQGSRDLNNPDNLTDLLSDTLFDFTNIQPQKTIGDDYCHCYKETDGGVNDSDIGFQVVLSKEMMSFDAFSFINIYGVHCFELIIGDYSNGVWSNHSSVKYKVTRVELDVTTNVYDNLIEVTNEFHQGQLIGYNILKYKKSSKTYVDSLKVVRNFDGFVFVNKPAILGGDDPSDFEYHLMMTAVSYQVPPDLVDVSYRYKNIGFKFYGVSSTDLTGIGEIVVGNLFQLVDYANSMETEMTDTTKLNDGDFGLSFSASNQYRPAIESWVIEMNTAGGDNNLKDVLTNIRNKDRVFVLVEQQSDGANISWPVHQGLVVFGSQDYEQRVELTLEGQNYFARATRSEEFLPPTLLLTYPFSVYDDNPFNIVATATDPEGGVLTYNWKGTFSEAPNSGDTFPYSMPDGSISDVITCEVISSASGLKTIKSASIIRASLPPIDRSVITVTENPVVTGGSATVILEIDHYMTPDLSQPMPDISPNTVWVKMSVKHNASPFIDYSGSQPAGAKLGYNTTRQYNISDGSYSTTIEIIGIVEPVTMELEFEDILGSLTYRTVTLTP